MGSVVLIIAAIAAFVVLSTRRAARRRRRLLHQVAQTMTAPTGSPDPLPGDLGQTVARAVQEALARQGLPTGSVSITSRVATPSFATTETARGDRPDAAGLAIGNVMSISSLSGTRVANVELDAIGAPKRRVTVDLPDDAPVARGDRVYVRPDPSRPDQAFYVPGLAAPVTRNRLDPLVLQPMLLARGEQGQAVVRAAEPADVGAGLPVGASGWKLDLEITPRNGFPYRAEITAVASTPEKAARLCRAGAAVPVRYDPDDPKTVAIDTAAIAPAPADEIGWPAELATDGAATIDWNSLAGLGKIDKIAAIRKRTGLDLTQAKALVDAVERSGGDATSQMVAMLSGRSVT